MDWKLSDNRPVFLQLIEHIQCAILTGQYPPGSRIPSVRELAAEAKVNPNTVQHALGLLEKDGLLVTQGTLGRFVTEDADIIERSKENLLHKTAQDCLLNFEQLGLSPKQSIEYLAGYIKKQEVQTT